MTFQLLARKYRPKTFAEVIGQGPTVQALKTAVFSGDRQTQVILLTGTRGVGKTTLARIMAKARNCQNRSAELGPCLVCPSCLSIDQGSSLDFLEMDGASHNGVENIRELIESTSYVPTVGPFKIYVIDEVHMLSTSAFNALLKTIEEPPAHVQFIFATTEVEKIPDTILSRCLRFDLKSIGVEVLGQYLKKIAALEKIQIDDGLIQILAREARGSIRDSLTLFDQVRLLNQNQDLGLETSELLGIAKEGLMAKIFQELMEGNAQKLNHSLSELFHSNVDEKRFSQQLLDKIFDETLKEKNPTQQMELTWIFETLSKDIDWALKSLIPDKAIKIILNKIAKRKEWAESQTTNPEDNKIEIASQAPKVILKALHFEDFKQMMQKLFHRAPGIYSHLQQGVFLGGEQELEEVSVRTNKLFLRIGFRKEANIFYEYFNDQQQKNLQSILVEALGFVDQFVKVDFQYPVEESEGRTFLEFQQVETQKKMQKQKTDLVESEVIRKLQKTFDAKIDSVFLSEQDQNNNENHT
ncbi:MAG: DNA polymerase III subunit gamma/tau [Bacteriovoracaceae bacterium]|nr:DNA polymerase III subunit gamma/tau [Bacteriovoracaceae bacterium]